MTPPLDDSAREQIATVVSGIEQYIAAGRNEEATALLEQLLPYIGQGIDFIQEPGITGLYSGLALACARLSRTDDASNYARRAIIEDPVDLLAHALLPANARILLARQLIHHMRHDLARDLLKTVIMTGQASDADFYLELLDFYDARKAEALRLPARAPRGDRRPTLISLVLWGETYIRKCLKYALPSLLAADNIPALAAHGEVILDIYTSEADQGALQADPVFNEAAKYAEIRITTIPDSLLGFAATESTPDPDRWCVAGAQYTAAIAARHIDADLAYVGIDSVFGDGYLSGAKQYIEGGYDVVVTSVIRAQEKPFAEYLKTHGFAHSRRIEIDGASLLNYCLQNMNQQIFDSFIRSETTIIGQDPATVFFRTDDGFASHTFQLNPAMISPDLLPDDFIYDFHTIDARFLAEIVDGRDPESLIKIIGDASDEIGVVDLDVGTEGAARNFGDYPVSVESCASTGLKWCNKESDLAYFEWAFRQRFTVPCDDQVLALPESDLEETNTVEEILAAFESSADETVQRIRIYNGYFR